MAASVDTTGKTSRLSEYSVHTHNIYVTHKIQFHEQFHNVSDIVSAQPRHAVCNPAYSVPVTRPEVGRQEGHLA